MRMKIRQRDVRDRDRHQIDARVARAALRPLAPQVDFLELVRETRVVEQELARQLLEQRALLTLALCARTILIQQGIKRGLRGGRGRLIRAVSSRIVGVGIRFHTGQCHEVVVARSSHATKNSG